MTSQKLENLLNLALNSAEDEREKSLNLNVGYDPLDREWDLIIKYSVNLDRVRKIASKVTELQNEYAVIRITESRIDILSGIPEVEYVEKPKRLFFQAAEGRRVSCINAVQDTRLSLYGQGILVAIIDSGIDYANIDFRNADGSTRIRYLWDQSLNPADGETAPVGYSIGVEYTKGQIDEALNVSDIYVQFQDKILGFETPPVIESGSTLVPMRFLFEQMGADVEWNQETQTATATLDNTAVTFAIDDTNAEVNNTPATMDVPARLINGKTMVPLRFLSEEMGFEVAWDAESRTAIIE